MVPTTTLTAFMYFNLHSIAHQNRREHQKEEKKNEEKNGREEMRRETVLISSVRFWQRWGEIERGGEIEGRKNQVFVKYLYLLFKVSVPNLPFDMIIMGKSS